MMLCSTTLSFFLLAGSSSLLSVFAAPVRTRQASNDLLVMQFADVLEQLESTFYSQALSKFQDSDFTDAGFLSSQIPLEQFISIQRDEQTHSTALQAGIKDFGGAPITNCKFNFDAALQDVVTMGQIARVIENVGVGAYLGAAHLISDPVLLTVAGSILTVEARHQTVLNILSGTGSAIPAAFDIALKPEEVLAIAIPFFSGPCNLGIQPNPTLTITNRGPVRPGSLLTFQSTAMNGNAPQDQLFCQMIVGGNPIALVFALSKCVVPSEVNGPVLIFITSDNQPLPNDVVNRTPNSLVAGPTMTFIDTEFQELGDLVLGGRGSRGGASGSGPGSRSGSGPGSDGNTLTRTVDPAVATSIMNGATGSDTVPATTTVAAPSVTTTASSDGSGSNGGGATTTTAIPTSVPASEPGTPTTAAGSSESSLAAPTASFAPTNGASSSSGATTPTPTPTAPSELSSSSSPGATEFLGNQGGPNMFTGAVSGGISVGGWTTVTMPSY